MRAGFLHGLVPGCPLAIQEEAGACSTAGIEACSTVRVFIPMTPLAEDGAYRKPVWSQHPTMGNVVSTHLCTQFLCKQTPLHNVQGLGDWDGARQASAAGSQRHAFGVHNHLQQHGHARLPSDPRQHRGQHHHQCRVWPDCTGAAPGEVQSCGGMHHSSCCTWACSELGSLSESPSQ